MKMYQFVVYQFTKGTEEVKCQKLEICIVMHKTNEKSYSPLIHKSR